MYTRSCIGFLISIGVKNKLLKNIRILFEILNTFFKIPNFANIIIILQVYRSYDYIIYKYFYNITLK